MPISRALVQSDDLSKQQNITQLSKRMGPVLVRVFVCFCQLDINWGHLGEGLSTEGLPPSAWPLGKPVEHFLG